MKKLPLLLSLLVIAALMLAACGGNANNGANDPAFDATQDAVDPVDPAVEPDPVLDPTLTEEVIVEEPVATETPMVEETMVVEETEVVEETPLVEETTEDGVPVTGEAGDYCYPNRLTHIVGSDLIDQNGTLIGEVEGVIVKRGAVTIMSTDDMLEDDAVVEDDAMTDPAMAQNGAAPMISYLLVDMVDDTELFEEDRDILIPFSALQAIELERQPLDVQDNCVFTLGQDVMVLQSAPYFEDNAWEDEFDLSVDGWDTEYNTYWTDQGVMFGNTAETGSANAVLLRDGFSIDVRNMEDESLGEIAEFIVNTENGNFEYGFLSRGGLLGLGASYYAIPVDQLTWVHFEDEMDDTFDIDDLGEFLLDINEEEFENIEGIDDIGAVDFTTEDWRTNADSFWMNRTPVPAEE